MDTMSAFLMGQANEGNELMVFDWDKAAKLIKESGCENAEAGLSGDWGCTGGSIFKDGKPDLEDYTYLASTWAIPELMFNDKQTVDCWKYQSEVPEWDSGTKWPESALAILNSNESDNK